MMNRLQKRFAALSFFLYIPKQPILSKVVFLNAYSHLFFFVQGLTLDERGRFSGEAEKKLEEVRICFSFIL